MPWYASINSTRNMDFVHFPFLSWNDAIVFPVSKEKSQQKICPNIHGFDAAFLPKISGNIVMPIQNHKILNISLFWKYLVSFKNQWNATVF